MDAKAFNVAMGAEMDATRRAHGMTQRELGIRLGVSSQQISKYLLGTNGLSAHACIEFAAAFGITVAELYARVDKRATNPEPAENDADAFMAPHYVRKMPGKERRALLPYLRSIVYPKRSAA